MTMGVCSIVLSWTVLLLWGMGARAQNSSSGVIPIMGTIAPTGGSTQTFSCNLCSGGSVGFPDKSIFVVGGGGTITCQTGQMFLEQATDETDCQMRRANMEVIPLDIHAWCGCRGTSSPNICPILCNTGGMVAAQDTQVTINNITMTCGEANLLPKYISDPTFCDQLGPAALQCCEGAPTPSPTTKPNITVAKTKLPTGTKSPAAAPSMFLPTTPAPTTPSSYGCSVCPKNSTMTNSSQALYFLKNNPSLTCAQLQTFVGSARTALDCIKHIGVMIQYPVDAISFCGCSGTKPRRLCPPFCPTSLEVMLPTKKISVLGVPMTCSQAEYLNTFVNNTEWCNAMVLTASPQCCFAIGGPTNPPTPALPPPRPRPPAYSPSATTSTTPPGGSAATGPRSSATSIMIKTAYPVVAQGFFWGGVLMSINAWLDVSFLSCSL